jgi:DivIVA domain-containing protein
MDAVSFFLVFLAIVLIGATVWAGAGGPSGIFRRRRPGRPSDGGLSDGGLLDGGFEQPVANLPPVLLPAEAAPADVDRVRFSLGLRGYRMDQVDQVLDELRDQLAAKHEEVERLRATLDSEVAERAAAIPGPGIVPEGGQPGPDGAEPPKAEPPNADDPNAEPPNAESPNRAAAEGGA